MGTDAPTEELRSRARAVLIGNELGASTKPAPNLYPHQWNWDSCFIAIGISHYDPERAMEEIYSLLKGQWANGLIPQIIFSPEGSGYFPGPDVWQSTRSPDAPKDVETSGITQPPILATSAFAIYNNTPDKATAREFLKNVYPAIRRYHQFFYQQRDPDKSGLIAVVHPWESGLDNSPPYLDAGSRVQLKYRPQYTRLDTLHVAAKNRPTNKDYDLFVYLLEQMRELDWDQAEYVKAAPLLVEDVLFNSILCRANRDLGQIAELVGEDPSEARAWNEKTKEAINQKLWDESTGTYFSYDRVAGKMLSIDTIAGPLALYGGVASAERAERLVARLQDSARYAPARGYPVPTTALNSPWFNAENYWLGPAWVNTNWMLVQGLRDYNQLDVARALNLRTIALVQKSGFREYFDPATGEGYGTDSFSWSAALTLDLLTS